MSIKLENIDNNFSKMVDESGSSIFIGGLEAFSIVDFPEKISAVVFLKGCPWRCPFCFNTEMQKLSSTSDHDWDEFKNFLIKRKGFLDAVVFSGGEALMQRGLKKAILEVKELGYLVALHTAGHYVDRLEEVLPYLDWVGLDIKSVPSKSRYKIATGGVDAWDRVSASLDLLIQSKIDFETRTTCDPRILSIEDIYEIATFLKSKGVKNYNLQRYRQLEGDNTPDVECEKFFQNKELKDFLKDNFEKSELRS